MSRNRDAGHNLEREVRLDFVDLGWEDAVCSRYESRKKDDSKVDICYTDPFNLQCKNMAKRVDYSEILSSMPEDDNMNVIVHKYTRKANTRFVEIGKYVIMDYDSFKRLAIIYQEWISLKNTGKIRGST